MSNHNYSRRRTDRGTRRMVQPEFGAKHPIVLSNEIDFFFSDVRYVLGEKLPPHEEVDRHGHATSRPPFHLYEDPDRMGITIMERRLPRRYAERKRIQWTPHDARRIKQGVADEISRLELAGRPLSVDLTTVIRLGAGGQSREGRKIGIIPEQASPVAELFVAEHEIIVDAISGGGLQKFNEVEQDFVPHFTLGRLYQEIEGEDFSKAIKAVQALLPLTIEVQPISLQTDQAVG